MEINLSNNLLNYIEQGVFHGLDHLRLLKISFNRLQAVNFEMLAEIPRVQGIDASHNLISRVRILFKFHVKSHFFQGLLI